MLRIGLDHRCVHCLLTWKVQKCSKYFRNTTLKHWKPFLDEDGTATLYHMGLKHIDANNTHDPQHLSRLEKQLFDAGLKGGYSKQTRCKYESSNALRDLHAQRPHATERCIKKCLSFEIARMHRRKLRALKSSRLQQLLSMPNPWKHTHTHTHTVVRQCAQRFRRHVGKYFSWTSGHSNPTIATDRAKLEPTGVERCHRADES